MGVRREAHSLSADSDDVRIYRDVVKWMREKSVENPLDPNGWAQHWAHHSLFCATNTFSYQVHYGWFFLPWHRAYLVNLEQKIRRLAQEPAFALPYWDWTHNNRIPDWYFGDDNPLMNSTRLQEQGDALPDDFIELGPIMRAARFDHFGGRKRIPGDLQVEGTLEQSAHNNVHNWIGGEMASFDGAGNEPIFQSHHGQVDRLWDAWLAQGDGRANPDDPDWLDNEFWFYASDGLPVVTRVWDVLETEALGYTFDNLDWRPTLRPETVPQLADQPLASASELGTIAPSEEMLAKIEVVRRGNGPGRVSLNYERMSVPIHPFQHRLFFVDDRAGGAATYVGTFTILPIPDLLSGLERTITSQVEVPPAALDALLAGGRVRVIGVGVPLKGREIPTQPIPFSGVSLTVEA
ncbi:MAG: tyrosinase family protein [Pseudomonadota bacterium]